MVPRWASFTGLWCAWLLATARAAPVSPPPQVVMVPMRDGIRLATDLYRVPSASVRDGVVAADED